MAIWPEHEEIRQEDKKMVYKNFQDLKLSALGMGAMRLPVIDGDDARIDESAAQKMVDYAMEHGVNYYDTAWGYHNGNSELVMGKALSKYPRDSYYLATKFPGYDLSNMDKVEEIFEKQLEKCGVEYFDFYLFHNVCEMNIDAYLNREYGIYEYLLKQKKEGRIRHLQSLPSVTGVLSGMSDMTHMQENIRTFEEDKPLNDGEMKALLQMADEMVSKIALPCTACHYCVSHCPQELDIPGLLALYNEHCFTGGGFIAPMAMSAIPEDKRPNSCIGCRSCEAVCPQQIKISEAMADFAQKLGM